MLYTVRLNMNDSTTARPTFLMVKYKVTSPYMATAVDTIFVIMTYTRP